MVTKKPAAKSKPLKMEIFTKKNVKSYLKITIY